MSTSDKGKTQLQETNFPEIQRGDSSLLEKEKDNDPLQESSHDDDVNRDQLRATSAISHRNQEAGKSQEKIMATDDDKSSDTKSNA